jgi:hypothetical protein
MSDLGYKAQDKLVTYPAKKYSAQFISVANSGRIFGGDSQKVMISIKNTGNTSWLGNGAHKLSITNSGGTISADLPVFGKSIEPGEIGNLYMNVSAPITNENVTQRLEAKIDGSLIDGGAFDVNFNIVTPDYRSRMVAKSPDQSVQSGQQFTLWVDYKNVGKNAWVSSDNIKLIKKDGSDSVFYTGGDWVSKTSPGTFDNVNISNGSTGRIAFVATAPSTPGPFTEKYIQIPEISKAG